MIWPYFYPPGGPNYGDGIGYGMAMLFYAFIAGLLSGAIFAFTKNKFKS